MPSEPSPAPASLPERPFLYAVIDSSLVGDRTLTEWARLLAGPGRAAVVQWRFKAMSDAMALAGAWELRAATREAGALFLVNDRPDIARIVGADGVHVGQEDLDPRDVRALLPGGLVGVSTHNRVQFESALQEPVDYIAVGPVFETTSKANPDPVVGLELISWARSRTEIPLVAIGGLSAGNAAGVVAAGARGLAVITGLMKARPPDEAAGGFLAAMQAGNQEITSRQ